MSDAEFVRLVAEMRTAQRAYFRSSSASALEDAKRYERRVDAELSVRVGSDGYRQRTMFGDDRAGG